MPAPMLPDSLYSVRSRLTVSAFALLLMTSVLFAQEGMPPAEVGVLPVQTESLPVLSELPAGFSIPERWPRRR